MKTVDYLLSLPSIRDRATIILNNPDHLKCFDLNLELLPNVSDQVCKLIERDYASPKDIPPHSRWRHFEAGPNGKKIDRITPLLNGWKTAGVGSEERVRRLLDLFVIGVLLDAGAGSTWRYKPIGEEDIYSRSEGLGIASFDLFILGTLSSDPDQQYQVDSKALKSLTPEILGAAFQVNDSNPLIGLEGRCSLLQRLGNVLEEQELYFKGPNGSRPGYLLDFLLMNQKLDATGNLKVEVDVLWSVIIRGFSGVWPPARTSFEGTSLGDVWPCSAMESISRANPTITQKFVGSESFVCFHKLSQWLTYSLMEPLALAAISFAGVENLTGLAEYRNGGVFVDMGVINLKPGVLEKVPIGEMPRYHVWEDVVVEWRALTVALLDKTATLVREKLSMSESELPLAKILEAGTWKAGREIAAKLRPLSKGPPIEVISDGTVF